MPTAERHAGRLSVLAESGQLFAEATNDLPRLLDLVARRFAEVVGDCTNIRLIDGDELVPVVTYHPDAEINDVLRAYHDTTKLMVGEGISGQVIATGEPYFMPRLDLEVLKQRVAPQFVSVFERIGIHGMIVVRLRARSINLGYLALFRTNQTRTPYTEEDLTLVKDLAERAALAIDTSRVLESLERRVAQRTEALEAANRELEAFAFSVSHDLKSPLRAIDGYARLVEEDYGAQLDDEGRRHLTIVRKNAQRMSHLIEDLLRLSRLGHRALHPLTDIDMREVVDAVLGGIRAAHPTVAIDVKIGELPRVFGNAELLRQVWQNLLDNAVKYSSRRDVALVEIDGRRQDGEVRYTVTDHGAGFDFRYADKLFGVFQRLHSDKEFEGTGVGLALVKRIVSRHGGRVWADSQVGAGATFGFGLPERGPEHP